MSEKILERHLMECVAHRLWQATVNNPYLKRLQRELENPLVGDWVLETTTLGNKGFDDLRFGKLVRIDEFVDPVTRKPEVIYVIKTLAGQEIPWKKARVIKILDTLWGRT
jgi:hypothetical protein